MFTRRDALVSLVGGASLAASRDALGDETKGAGEKSTEPAFAPGKHGVVPLPFAPKSLKGLSERLIVSHHENNYAGAVKNLNKVEEELARTIKDTPSFLVAGLRERELTFGNSVVLHELYFANLGGNGKMGGPDGSLAHGLAASFGSVGRWEEQFRAVGLSLAGGSGWALLDLSLRTGELHVHWSGGHPVGPASAVPLLVMDMYEHAYQMDFGAAAARYVDAFFANVNWDQVNRRHEHAVRAWRAMQAV